MDLLWNVITPILGVAVSTIQVIPPLNAVLLCRKARSLGALNATPWAIGFVNCFGHVVYGAMLQDVFIMSSVGPGVMIHYFAVTSATALLGAQGKFDTVGRLENIVLFGLTLYVVLAFLIGTTLSRTKEDYDVALLVVGSVNSLNTMVFYCAPFSKVKKVLRTKDAASLYLPALLVMV
ncbi:hypothetical protein B484DRAFT_421530 [Ochromonadaceae sp. CCMP2298]|nr:hypothetical protein B484DRAFT_421530 [Ochromonadaceae sp. CCMP2298]